MAEKQDTKRWVVVYPAYINHDLSSAEGRRIPMREAVKDPGIFTLNQACRALGLTFTIEVGCRGLTRRRRATRGSGGSWGA